MANTYYDSQLTAAEIEAALEAIDGVIVPANNGKVLAINNGKLEARSVQWGGGEPVLEPLSVNANGDYTPEAGVDGFDEVHVAVPNSYSASDEGKVVSNGALVAQTARASQITQNGTYDTTLNDEVTVNVSGGGAVVQPLSVTQNGTYNPPSGVDGYAPVIVNVSGGGGGDIDLSYLPNSTQLNVLASKNVQFLNYMSGFINLSAQNTDVTCYCCVKCLDASECILMDVPYSLSNGNAPSFYTSYGSYNVDCTVYSGNTNIPGLSCSVDHVYALSIDSTNRKVRYFYDGIYFMEKTFSNSGDNVCFGRGQKNSTYYIGTPLFSYIGVVSELESDATVIANMQTIMQKLGLN